MTCAHRYGGWWLLPLVVCALAGCGSASKVSAENPANAPHVAVVPVAKKTLSSNLEIASEFQPYQEINVYAKVSGYIKELRVNWGTHVKQGQLLAVLEIPELQQQLEWTKRPCGAANRTSRARRKN